MATLSNPANSLLSDLPAHTPAPWYFNESTNVIANANGLIAEILPVCIDATPDAVATEKANGHLICASPLMLAALRFALPLMEDLAASSNNRAERHAVRLMREAIKASEGKTK
jgi:hypothetical protein